MKKIIALLLALVMVFALVACGEKDNAETPETPNTPVETPETGSAPVGIAVFAAVSVAAAAAFVCTKKN